MPHVSSVRQPSQDFEDPDIGEAGDGFADPVQEAQQTEDDYEGPNDASRRKVYRHPNRWFWEIIHVEDLTQEELGRAEYV